MKAIRVHEFGAPEVMRLEDVPEPVAGAGEVVVQVSAVGVNPVDTYIRAGAYPNVPPTPYTPGSNAAGRVRVTGEGVTRVRVGDRVYVAGTTSGAYAEFTLCKETNVHRLPQGYSDAEGACVGVPYATAYYALHLRAQVEKGETVLVHGATGGVGIAAVQLAHNFGCRVIGTGGTPRGRALVFAQGADHVLDHTEENYLQQVSELTDGQGVDVILEMLANVNLGNDLKALAKKGRVVVIGSRGRVEIDPRDLMGRDASIHGMSLPNATPEEYASIHEQLGAALRDGAVRPIINVEMPLADAPQAHHEILESKAYGKIILIP